MGKTRARFPFQSYAHEQRKVDPMKHRPWQLIKGAGDIGSAVAHRLKRVGLRPLLLEHPRALVSRRRMAFGAAMQEGEVMLEGLRGLLCPTPAAAWDCLEIPDDIPLLVTEGETVPELPPPVVVIDARMRKKSQPPTQLAEAPLVLGIGPGFRAGQEAHGVVESNWGEALGAVLWHGATEAYTGKHRKVEGFGAERYLYAPHAGIFHTYHAILAPVRAGEVVGHVTGKGGETPLVVPIGGVLRGLVCSGSVVEKGGKLVEVDPRGDPALCQGIAQRPGKIADGVLAALREKMATLF